MLVRCNSGWFLSSKSDDLNIIMGSRSTMHKHIFALRVKYAQSKTFAQKDIFAEGVTFEQNHFCTIVEKKKTYRIAKKLENLTGITWKNLEF